MLPPVYHLTSSQEALILALKIALIPLSLIALLLQFRLRTSRNNRRRAPPGTVLVLSVSPGLQSPRAVAHVRAIATHTDYTPLLVAQAPLPVSVNSHPLPSITIQSEQRTPIVLLKRVFHSVQSIIETLDQVHNSHANISGVLLNVPPSIPTIIATRVWLFARCPHAKLIIDWHNTASSILAANRVDPVIVRLASFIENWSARFAHTHWCVSDAMRVTLPTNSIVLRDAPTDAFKPAPRQIDGTLSGSPQRTHELLLRVAAASGASRAYPAGETALTQASGSLWRMQHIIRLAVSSTSWTPDEDFDPFLDALKIVNDSLNRERLLVIVTGRGPMREQFEKKVADMKLRNVRIWCAWLSRDDYAALLAVADIGVSMHQSSSGLDLPMKAVDMLGAGTPVLARRYQCVGELVRDGENGLLFDDAAGLASALWRYLLDDGAMDRLRVIRNGARQTFPTEKRWQSAWENIAKASMLDTFKQE